MKRLVVIVAVLAGLSVGPVQASIVDGWAFKEGMTDHSDIAVKCLTCDFPQLTKYTDALGHFGPWLAISGGRYHKFQYTAQGYQTDTLQQYIPPLSSVTLDPMFLERRLSGPTEGTLGPGDYIVYDDISVEAGDSLTIVAGTRLLFLGTFRLLVNGYLRADGTYQDSVIFTVHPENEYQHWCGLIFVGADGGCRMEYSRIEKSQGFYYDPYYDPELFGGILCMGSSPFLENCTITDNEAGLVGGGIRLAYGSSPELWYCDIVNNRARGAGGLSCSQSSSPYLFGCNISGNHGRDFAGGMNFYAGSDPVLENCTITNDSTLGDGGGIYMYLGCEPTFKNCTIKDNWAQYYGGGICCYDSDPIIGTGSSRCNIYMNKGGLGKDLFTTNTISRTIYCDTFTVIDPWDYYAYPAYRFSFDILHAVYPQVDYDLYVSPDGDDNNDGRSPETALKSITWALAILEASSLSPKTIHILPGLYSTSATGEEFPLIASSWVDLEGVATDECVIDAERQATVLYCLPDGITIDSLTITGGYGDYGGGLHFYNSEATLLNCKITGNQSPLRGGGIYCREGVTQIRNNRICHNDCDDEGGGVFVLSSDAAIAHCVIDSNHAYTGGGMCILSSSPTVDSCDIKNNDADIGGGIKIGSGRTNLRFCTVTDNTANLGAGLHTYSDRTFIRNCTFTGNVAGTYGGGVYVFSLSEPVAVNTIIWGNSPESIYDKVNGTFTATYCDIEGGWTGTGNIDCDPEFADPLHGDYHLTEGSCCIDTGDPDPQYNDPDGTRADIGAFYFPHEGGYLCGDIWGVLRADGSPYTVTCDITVADGRELIIEPGVSLLFEGHYKFNVYGTLKAIGTSEDSIFFTHYSADEDSTWHGIRFDEADAPCSLKYCQIEYGFASGLPPDNCGGAIYAFSSDLYVGYCTIAKNRAMHAGGGLYAEITDLHLYRNLIVANEAIDQEGGGIYYAYHSQSNPICSLLHCTFTDNFSGGGGECAVFWDYWSPKLNASASADTKNTAAKLFEKSSHPVVLNCIFWDDWPGEIFSKGNSTITYCDVTGGYPGEGNIDCDPVFCEPEAGNYYVIDTSCCVGAGYGGAIIGAFGIGCYAIDCGDVDGSRSVNILDVGSIINYLYREAAPPLETTVADVDASGTVNLVDAMHLIKYLYKDGSEPDCRKQLAK